MSSEKQKPGFGIPLEENPVVYVIKDTSGKEWTSFRSEGGTEEEIFSEIHDVYGDGEIRKIEKDEWGKFGIMIAESQGQNIVYKSFDKTAIQTK